MRHTFMWSSEGDMVKNSLGLSRLSKFVKPGAVVYLLLSVNVSTHVHLKIYSGLNTALLDISANTSAKVPVLIPKSQMKMINLDLKHSGAEWQGLFHGLSGNLHADFLQMERSEKLLFTSSPTWTSLLRKDLSSIFDADSFHALPVTLRLMSMDYTFLQDVWLSLPSRVGLHDFLNFVNFSLFPVEFKELLQKVDIFPQS